MKKREKRIRYFVGNRIFKCLSCLPLLMMMCFYNSYEIIINSVNFIL